MPPSQSFSPSSTSDAPILRVRGLETRIGGRILHRQIDLDLHAGEVLAVVGASGAGKSVLLRAILGLIRPSQGTVEVFGRNPAALDPAAFRSVEARWGVLFQDGALFSSLTVAENIEVPLKQQLDLPKPLMETIAELKIALVGLPPDTAGNDPALLFLDEPTAGLDPIAASAFDMLLRDLQKSLGLAVMMVTHDLDSLVALADRIAVLVDGRLKLGTLDQMLQETDPWIKEYFSGPRGRAARPNLVMGDGD